MNKIFGALCLIGLFIALVFIVNSEFFAHEENKVYVTKTGNCYHSYSCHYTARSCRAIGEDTAIKNKYVRCSVCGGKSVEKIIVNDYMLSVGITALVYIVSWVAYLFYADYRRKNNESVEE